MVRRLSLAALAFMACGPLELRIDETKGVPSLSGTTQVDLGSFTCGEPLSSGDFQVNTRQLEGACEFTFTHALEVLQTSDYQNIGELKTAANLVQRIELTIQRLDFTDGAGATLSLDTQVTSASLHLGGQQVASRDELRNLPHMVQLSGAALNELKAKIDARQPATVNVQAIAVLPNEPPPPARIGLAYEAQPAIILGPGEITIF